MDGNKSDVLNGEPPKPQVAGGSRCNAPKTENECAKPTPKENAVQKRDVLNGEPPKPQVAGGSMMHL